MLFTLSRATDGELVSEAVCDESQLQEIRDGLLNRNVNQDELNKLSISLSHKFFSLTPTHARIHTHKGTRFRILATVNSYSKNNFKDLIFIPHLILFRFLAK